MGEAIALKTEQYRKSFNKADWNIPFFSELSSDEAKVVDMVIIKKRFAKGQIVLSEEETSKYMYLIYSGKVRVVKQGDDGREQIITFHKKGEFFGEMSLLDGNTSPATVIAHEDAVIGLLHKNDFEYYLLNLDSVRRKIIELLCFRLRDAWKMIKVLSLESAEYRVMVILDRLRELYGVNDDRGTIINLRIKHQMIASYASVSRETATRILNKLEKFGEIETLDNRCILLKHSFFKKMREFMQ